jgi:uncharacterized protein YwqG
MDQGKILKSLSMVGLNRVRGEIAQLLQESIRIQDRPADESQLGIGESKIGGVPDLPAGISWPAYKNIPMSFIAQFRMVEVSPNDSSGTLPKEGILYFFYDAFQETYGEKPGDQAGWKVIYSGAKPTQLWRTSFPDDLPLESRFNSCSVSFSKELTLPQSPSVFLPGWHWSDEEKTHYEDFQYGFSHPSGPPTPIHRMLGHADVIQDDMHLQAALYANGVPSIDDPRAAAFKKTALDWVILLQVDSEPLAGMRWASSGMLYYWIERQALRERRFDHVWLVLQSE